MVVEETLAGCARHHVVVRLVLGALMRLGLIVVVVNIAESNDAEVRISEVCKLCVRCACAKARRVQAACEQGVCKLLMESLASAAGDVHASVCLP